MPVYRPEELAENWALMEPESDDLVTTRTDDAAEVSAESGVEGVVGSFRPAALVYGALPTHDRFRVRVQIDLMRCGVGGAAAPAGRGCGVVVGIGGCSQCDLPRSEVAADLVGAAGVGLDVGGPVAKLGNGLAHHPELLDLFIDLV